MKTRDQDMSNRHSSTTRKAVATAALLAAAGLALAGCKNSTSASGSGGSSGGSGSSSSSSSSGGSGGSGGSSGGSGSSTASSFFPSQVGNTWVYEDKLSGTKSTVTNKIVKVTPVSAGQRVVMKTTDTGDAGAASHVKLVYIFHSDGSITVPVAQFGDGDIKVLNGALVWPSAAGLASGQENHSTVRIEATIDGRTLKMTEHVTVKGGGSHSVTVPAGHYNAQLIITSEKAKFDGFPINTVFETWVAPGVGPIKSELLGKGIGSKADTLEVLKSFTKG
jgi:hypothetical protein